MSRPCFECGLPADHDHHVVPASRGGRYTLPLCSRCHALAHNASSVTLSREAKERKARQGGYLGGRPPYGWALVGADLVPVEAEQKAIAEIGRLYLEGFSAYAICAKLDKDGHPSRGQRWGPAIVIRVLKRLNLWGTVSP
jgi:hypothetical protein